MNNYKYCVKSISFAAPGIVDIEIFNRNGGPVFDFKPGQYAMISYRNANGGIEDKHAFSLAGSPARKDVIRFGIRIQGNFTQGISKLKEGDDVFVSGPFGNFVFDEDKHKNLVMFAGGIGITPFLSAASCATDKKLDNKLSLIYSNRTVEQTAFLKEIKQLERANKNFSVLLSITDEKIPSGIKGVVNERINKDIIKNFVGETAGKYFFLCGPPPFMNAVKESLLEIGVSEPQIEMEEFSMIPDAGVKAKIKNFSYAFGLSVALAFMPFYAIYGAGKQALDDNQQKAAASKAIQALAANNPALVKINQLERDIASDSPKNLAGAVSSFINKITQSPAIKTTQLALAPEPLTSASIPAEETASMPAQTQTTQNQIAQTPAPTTSASTPASTNNQTQTQAQNNNTSNQNQTAPAPTTSASTPAPIAPASTATQTNSTPAASSAPTPTTSASIPVEITPTPTATNNQVPNPTPTPTTSASAPAPTISSSTSFSGSTTPVASNPTPAPSTSASTPAVSITPPSQNTISTPSTNTSTQKTKSRDDDDHDDDDDEDDD